MHTHDSMFGFLDSPQYLFYHILPFFNSDLKKKSIASKHYAIFTFFKNFCSKIIT